MIQVTCDSKYSWNKFVELLNHEIADKGAASSESLHCIVKELGGTVRMCPVRGAPVEFFECRLCGGRKPSKYADTCNGCRAHLAGEE